MADFGDRDGVDLGGLFVTEDERIFVCDYNNRRILIEDSCEKSSSSELDVSELGKPSDLLVEDRFLNVLIHTETGDGWVQQFALPPTLEP